MRVAGRKAVKSSEVGRRIAASIPAGTEHDQIAERIGLAPEKFSRCLAGRRAFSLAELAALANVLNVDVQWLITGTPDPQRLVAMKAVIDYELETIGSAAVADPALTLSELLPCLWPNECPLVAANADLEALSLAPLHIHGVDTVGQLRKLLMDIAVAKAPAGPVLTLLGQIVGGIGVQEPARQPDRRQRGED